MAKQRNTGGDLTAGSFDWALIRSFLAVLDAGSLLGAARQLGSSQPTVGRQVEALERQLGLPLFERTGRGVMPTEAATRIAADARRIQQGAERLAASATAGPGELAGLVRVSASRMVALYVLPAIVAEFQKQAPEIDIAVVASDEVSNLLRRDADIAVRMVDPKQSSVIARRLGQIEIVPCARRDYLARHGTPKTIADLFEHRLIGPDHDQMVLEQMRALAASIGYDLSDARRVFRCDDFPTQLAAIQAGLGVGFAAEPWVRRDPELAILSLPMPPVNLPMWLAVHREIRGNKRIRLVYDFLARELGRVYF